MEHIDIEILAALRQQTVATIELSNSVNNLRLEIEQPVDYVKLGDQSTWSNRVS